MIYSLKGELIFADFNTAVIECAGVGYKCTISLNTQKDLPKINNPIMLYTYMNVRDDAVDLFGFSQSEELEAFKLLTSVNGVGPKVGVAILSEFSHDKLVLAIATGDSKMLTKAVGVGPKLAQRIILELKDKVTSSMVGTDSIDFVDSTKINGSIAEAIAALVSLGYSQSEAASAVAKSDENMSVEEIIKTALKKLF